jgi:cation transport ATPase
VALAFGGGPLHLDLVRDSVVGGAWFTPVGVVVAAIGWAVSGFLAVLVIATPCPLLLSIPIAIIGAVSVAASRGTIIRNPGVLEVIDPPGR